jgi:hypothetical protein
MAQFTEGSPDRLGRYHLRFPPRQPLSGTIITDAWLEAWRAERVTCEKVAKFVGQKCDAFRAVLEPSQRGSWAQFQAQEEKLISFHKRSAVLPFSNLEATGKLSEKVLDQILRAVPNVGGPLVPFILLVFYAGQQERFVCSEYREITLFLTKSESGELKDLLENQAELQLLD